jgi:hypothetical protein
LDQVGTLPRHGVIFYNYFNTLVSKQMSNLGIEISIKSTISKSLKNQSAQKNVETMPNKNIKNHNVKKTIIILSKKMSRIKVSKMTPCFGSVSTWILNSRLIIEYQFCHSTLNPYIGIYNLKMK